MAWALRGYREVECNTENKTCALDRSYEQVNTAFGTRNLKLNTRSVERKHGSSVACYTVITTARVRRAQPVTPVLAEPVRLLRCREYMSVCCCNHRGALASIGNSVQHKCTCPC